MNRDEIPAEKDDLLVCKFLEQDAVRVGLTDSTGQVWATSFESVSAGLRGVAGGKDQLDRATPIAQPKLLAPLDRQEVWGAGVTYTRSRAARMEESQATGGASFYDRVYEADRPELFFKATPGRTVGSGQEVIVRRDSSWTVPEPELALWLDPDLEIVGIGLGNDITARDIEAENLLYLPQAKTWVGSCALGPAVLPTTSFERSLKIDIRCSIERDDREIWSDAIGVSALHRRLEDLVAYLGRDNSFPDGVVLLTGTGIVPPDDISLADGDVVSVASPALGILRNPVRVGL